MEPKLTIAIPTYNGGHILGETLDNILAQLEENVEILISDNASTDDTSDIVREYQGRCPVLRYVRNEVNLGADRNFDLAVRRSRGEFVWLFGDDDALAPGAVRSVLEIIGDYGTVAAIFVNYAVFSSDMKNRMSDKEVPLEGDVFCRGGDEFLGTVGIGPIFVSSNVVRRSLWEKSDSGQYIGSGWVHYGTLLSLARGECCYCIAHPYVHLRGAGNWGAGGGLYRNTVNLAEIISGLPRLGYNKTVVAKTRKSISRRVHSTIRSARNNGLAVDWDLLKRSIFAFWSTPMFWLCGLPRLLVPLPLYAGYKRFEKGVKKRLARMGLHRISSPMNQ